MHGSPNCVFCPLDQTAHYVHQNKGFQTVRSSACHLVSSTENDTTICLPRSGLVEYNNHGVGDARASAAHYTSLQNLKVTQSLGFLFFETRIHVSVVYLADRNATNFEKKKQPVNMAMTQVKATHLCTEKKPD